MTRKYTTITVLLLLATAAAGADKPNFLEKIFGRKPKRDTSGAAKEGNYTILLHVSRGHHLHIAQAKRYKANTEKYTGWKNLFIVHKEDHSLLFWGKYDQLKDAQPNLKKAKKYLAPAKIQVFAKAIVVPLPGKTTAGPAEWDIDNTDPKYVYTVLVAEFHDVPEADYVGRKKFAVEFCKQLRGKRLAAFYRHTATESIVTVGLFGKDAIKDVSKNGKTVRTIKDPNVKLLFQRFPKLAVNGREKIITGVAPNTRRVSKIPAPSYLMKIPRKKIPNAPTTRPSPKNGPGHPKPGKTQGDAASTGRSADKPYRPGGTRRD